MKQLILGIAVLGLAVACKNTDNTAVSDSATAPAPEACAAGCESESACGSESACEMSAGCESESACESKDAMVCPVTGQKVEG
jgi:hypothetical protein